MRAASPGVAASREPTMEILATWSSTTQPLVTPPASQLRASSRAPATNSSSRMNVMRPSWAELALWMMSRTLMPAAARSWKTRAAMPGSSGTPGSVNLAIFASPVTATTSARSMMPAAPRIHVPPRRWKLLCTWMGTSYSMHTSAARGCRTLAPLEAISMASS